MSTARLRKIKTCSEQNFHDKSRFFAYYTYSVLYTNSWHKFMETLRETCVQLVLQQKRKFIWMCESGLRRLNLNTGLLNDWRHMKKKQHLALRDVVVTDPFRNSCRFRAHKCFADDTSVRPRSETWWAGYGEKKQKPRSLASGRWRWKSGWARTPSIQEEGELALQVSVSEVSGSFDTENVVQDAGGAQASTMPSTTLKRWVLVPIASSAPLPTRFCSLLWQCLD